MRRVWSVALGLAATLGCLPLAAQPLDPSLYADLRWRLIGPFRGGWGTVAEGVPDEPDRRAEPDRQVALGRRAG